MPNVERYCTYRQSLTYVWNNFDFLGDPDQAAIFREGFSRGQAVLEG